MSLQILRSAVQPIRSAYPAGMDNKLFTGFLSYEGQAIWMRGGSRKRRSADPVRDQELATGHGRDVLRDTPVKPCTSRLLPVENTDGGMRYATPADEMRDAEVEPGGNDLGEKHFNRPGGNALLSVSHPADHAPVGVDYNALGERDARHLSVSLTHRDSAYGVRADRCVSPVPGSSPGREPFSATPTPYDPSGEIPGDPPGFTIDMYL